MTTDSAGKDERNALQMKRTYVVLACVVGLVGYAFSQHVGAMEARVQRRLIAQGVPAQLLLAEGAGPTPDFVDNSAVPEVSESDARAKSIADRVAFTKDNLEHAHILSEGFQESKMPFF